MKKKSKILKTIFILLLFILLISGVFFYYSYFYYSESRNSNQNDNAHKIHILAKHYVEDNFEVINPDMVLSNNSKYEINNINNINIDDILKEYSQKENKSFNNGCYYIEIRNKKVYKVIYAKWKYSGYVGTSPEPNGICTVYMNEVNKALDLFSNYIQEKQDY